MTMRAVDGLPSFREQVPFERVAKALARASKDGFRVVHFSVQSNHVHLIVEADGADELRTGAQGLAICVARALNKAFRRSGKVWSARHERHDLRSPSEVRNALVYVLFNFRKHARGAAGREWALRSLDPKSSAFWFDGWSPRAGPAFARLEMEAKTWLARGRVVVEPPTVWLLTTGWRRHGLLQASESPRVSLVD
jgi:putative transposase